MVSDYPVVSSQAEARAAAEAGHEIVETQVVIGMRCDICGPLPFPFTDRLLLVEEAKRYQEMHWLAKHPGVPRRSERTQVKDGQHRQASSIVSFDNDKENDR